MRNYLIIVLISAITSGLVASYGTSNIINRQKKTTNDLIKEFYEVENAVHISPHSIRKNMDKGDKSFILVDLRSPQEYEKEHIVGAVNIPAYKDPNTSAYDEVDRIVSQFAQLVKLDKSRDIIVYCYSMPCMTGRKIGLMLIEHGIFVKHLNIGWNEWRYYWDLWNHDGETLTKVEDYIVSGKEPGIPKVKKDLLTPCSASDFGC